MKVHAPIPFPMAPLPTPAKSDLQLASSKARLAFEQALGAKPGLEQRTQAGAGRQGRSGTASRQAALSAALPAVVSAPVAASPDAPSAAAGDSPYVPGALVNIKA